MKTTILKGSMLPPDIIAAWAGLQQANSNLASPYFAPAFSQIVASARSDVEVAVVQNDGNVVALFPYQRGRFDIAGPVGGFISDYHGVISGLSFSLDPRELLRACGLVTWNFNHIPASQLSFAPFHREHHRSPIIDLSAGYEVYVVERRERGTEQIKKNGNLMRRLEREVGPLRLVVNSPDRELLSQLLEWKTAQFRRNRWRDLFSIPWVREVVERIHAVQTTDFAGILSALYAGDHLVAAHFGMRSASVWHYWFPTYDPMFSKYSPGVMLLLKMAEAAPTFGIRTIDMGCGEHSYKWRLMNGVVATAKGSVELNCPTNFARRLWAPVRELPFQARRLVSKTPIGTVVRRIRDGRSGGSNISRNLSES